MSAITAMQLCRFCCCPRFRSLKHPSGNVWPVAMARLPVAQAEPPAQCSKVSLLPRETAGSEVDQRMHSYLQSVLKWACVYHHVVCLVSVCCVVLGCSRACLPKPKPLATAPTKTRTPFHAPRLGPADTGIVSDFAGL